MKILYMCAELMGYNIPVLEELVLKHHAKILLIHWDHKKLTIYKAPYIEGVTYYKRSQLTSTTILELAKSFKPNIAYVPNWYDKGYLKTCRYLKTNKVPVVSGLDNQWHGTLKQRLGVVFMKIYFKKYFSHMWVAGPYQFEFAKRLGFKNKDIIFNLYSADVQKFYLPTKDCIIKPLNFLFVGRLEEVKGIRDLLLAWDSFPFKSECSLTIIGDGSLEPLVKKNNSVIHHHFLQPADLIEKIKGCDCFILPSLFEPYGVVIHEFVCARMAIIASDKCGAAPMFVIPGHNGYIFKSGNFKSLLEKMVLVYNKTDKELLGMMNNSLSRSHVITPSISASSLVSAINTL